MRFSRVAFNRHLANVGQQILWHASYACPCINKNSGASDPRCPLCTGVGRVWDKGVKTVVGIASQKTQERWAKLGMYEVGDMVLSIPENSPMWDRGGQFDRVVTLNGLDGFSEVLTRGAPTEKLRFKVSSISRVFWRNPKDPREMVEGGIPTVDENGLLSWKSGEPPAGVTYSISGDRFSEYFMIDGFPSDRNQHSGMRLPKNVVLRKWDLFGRNSRLPINPS
ncbi:MAG: hypothetical protein ACRCUB_07190 [Plesiomonas shigelloides]